MSIDIYENHGVEINMTIPKISIITVVYNGGKYFSSFPSSSLGMHTEAKIK